MFIVDAKQGNVMNVSNSVSPTATVTKQSVLNVAKRHLLGNE